MSFVACEACGNCFKPSHDQPFPDPSSSRSGAQGTDVRQLPRTGKREPLLAMKFPHVRQPWLTTGLTKYHMRVGQISDLRSGNSVDIVPTASIFKPSCWISIRTATAQRL
jgi:hypothetical protein